MGSLRLWLLLLAAQIVVLFLLAAAGPVTQALPALRYAVARQDFPAYVRAAAVKAIGTNWKAKVSLYGTL